MGSRSAKYGFGVWAERDHCKRDTSKAQVGRCQYCSALVGMILQQLLYVCLVDWLIGWLVVLPVLGVGFLLALVQGCTLVVPCFLYEYVEYLGPYCCVLWLFLVF